MHSGAVLADADQFSRLHRDAGIARVRFHGYRSTLLPRGAEVHYAERPLFIDPCYMPSDSKRLLDQQPISRAQYGLPDRSTVLCAFGGTYKILPEVFAAWMALLKEHSRAVLWLRDAGQTPASACGAKHEAKVLMPPASSLREPTRCRAIFPGSDWLISTWNQSFRLAHDG